MKGKTRNADVAADKAIARKAIRQHENAQHGGKHETLKLKAGGDVLGATPKSRPDRIGRGAKKVNINITKVDAGGPSDRAMAAKMGVRHGIKLGAAMAAPKAPMAMTGPAAGPTMGGPPPVSAVPGGPAGPMSEGGKVRMRPHVRRAAGGRV